MISSQNPKRVQREQGPDTLPALREMLIQDPRIGRAEIHPDAYDSPDRHDDTAPKAIHHAPSIAPMAPSLALNAQLATPPSDRIATKRPSVARRVFRTGARGFIVIVVVGGTFALLSSGDVKKQDILGTWDLSLSWLSSVLHTNLSQSYEVAAGSISKPLDQTPSQNTALLPATPGIQSAPASVVIESSPETQHRLETMASDLADVRRLVERLAARQDQMARDIATLQTAEQTLSERLSSLPEPPAVHLPRKKAIRTHKIRLGSHPDHT